MAQERAIGDMMRSGDCYFIPDYQRGYKWSVGEVWKLLDDVSHFRPDEVPYYCLQNITLVPNGVDVENHCRFNVVDGQQRLTTSIVIISYFNYLHEQNNEVIDVVGKMTYGVRMITDRFLRDEISTGKIWRETPAEVFANPVWSRRMPEVERARTLRDLFASRVLEWAQHGEHGRDHQDIFHLFCAAMVLGAYFRNKTTIDRHDFIHTYLNDVKFIVNIVEGIRESVIFSKINGFRVPLDGADLLRGLFITNVSRAQVDDYEGAEREVVLSEGRIKAGLELDTMNAWWGDDSRRQYFSMFDDIEDPDGIFNVEQYPINLLYRLFVLSKGDRQILLEQFENQAEATRAQFEEIKRFHEMMQDWYSDKKIYHFAGFLRAQTDFSFRELCAIWGAQNSRKMFCRNLKEHIFDRTFRFVDVHDDRPSRRELFEEWSRKILDNGFFDWYNSRVDIIRFLVLVDIIGYTREAQADAVNNPIADHMSPSFFKQTKEDKEHVFPRTPVADEDLRGHEEEFRGKMASYWQLIMNRNVMGVDDEERMLRLWNEHWRQGLDATIAAEEPFPIANISHEWFRRLVADENGIRDYVKDRINKFVSDVCGVDINSIGNIVLLNAQTNRSYGNDFYTDKRRRILSDYRNNLSIRLHTRSVFAKEFPNAHIGEADQFDVWSQNSIIRNREDMAAQLGEFFMEVVNA